MSFPYKHVLLIGATAGIGRAMADRFAETGLKVTAVGRRQERLDEFVNKYGADKASGVAFDISDTSKIPEFAESVLKAHPDIDCLFLNAGTQSIFDLSEPAGFDLAKFIQEVTLNFNSMVALAHAFLPHLIKQETPTSIIFTGSNIAIVPAATLAAYCSSKAALNVFTLCLRDNLRDTNVKVIEVSPPPVQTELHDYMGEEKGRALGMPVDQFTNEAHKGLLEGKDQIVVGAVGNPEIFHEIVDKRRQAFTNLASFMRSLAH
ncbi:uncharacterized protein N7459_000828 [Penicillium hispanicum]|uniref:uncharacterized protein n=1 Tax=Penicillium hispanicum TaxID=1080232 RepID=UPI00254129AD|nr:uncharacterized protein N7459_000828 [Penicillium hispanicum]KAJ5594620.1 hypothetical protein N7459_000828 [Penicillium hispanicum]